MITIATSQCHNSSQMEKISWQLPDHTCSQLRPKQSDFAVVIPVWNEGDRIINQLKAIKSLPVSLDIILADFYSDDGSMEPNELRNLGVTTLTRTHERGLGSAIRLGIGTALSQGYLGVITIDGNGKDGVEALVEFESLLRRGVDFIQGSRFLPGGTHENTPLLRLLAIRLFASPLMSAAARVRFTDPTNGFKGMSARYLGDRRLAPLRDCFKFFSMQFYLNRWPKRLGYATAEIPVSRNYPPSGTVPTKIVGLRLHLLLIRELIAVVMGRFDPGDS